MLSVPLSIVSWAISIKTVAENLIEVGDGNATIVPTTPFLVRMTSPIENTSLGYCCPTFGVPEPDDQFAPTPVSVSVEPAATVAPAYIETPVPIFLPGLTVMPTRSVSNDKSPVAGGALGLR